MKHIWINPGLIFAFQDSAAAPRSQPWGKLSHQWWVFFLWSVKTHSHIQKRKLKKWRGCWLVLIAMRYILFLCYDLKLVMVTYFLRNILTIQVHFMLISTATILDEQLCSTLCREKGLKWWKTFIFKAHFKNTKGFRGSYRIIIQFAIIGLAFLWLNLIDPIQNFHKRFS